MSKALPKITLEARGSVYGNDGEKVHVSSLCAKWADAKSRYHIWINTKTFDLTDVIHKNPLDLTVRGHKALDASAKVHEPIIQELKRIVTKENAEKAIAAAAEIERTRLRAEKSASAQRVRVVLEDVGEDVLPARLKAEIATFTDEQILRFAAIIRSA